MSAYDEIWRETRAVIEGSTVLSAFAGVLPAAPDIAAPAPRVLPHVAKMAGITALASDQTRALAETIAAAAPALDWRQSYTAEQVGAAYLGNYGWFNLMSPEGPVQGSIRISFGYWGQGLHYPRHWHAPEEIYFVIAGDALFCSDGEEDARLSAGSTRHHRSDQPHAMVMDENPLLAFAIWRGDALLAKPEIGAPK